jgi:hypothetical protein
MKRFAGTMPLLSIISLWQRRVERRGEGMRGIMGVAWLIVLSLLTPFSAFALADLGWQHMGYANEVVAMAGMHGRLYAASRYNKLWMREPTPRTTRWRLLGSANRIVALAGVNEKLFGTTEDHKLWMRNPLAVDAPWQHVGYADAVVAMAALEGKLYAATRGNKLLVSDPVPWNFRWQVVGDAAQAVALAGLDGQLFVVTKDHKLMRRDPTAGDSPWQSLGDSREVTALAGLGGKLFAATRDNKVWMATPPDALPEVLQVVDISIGAPEWLELPDVESRVVVTMTFNQAVTPPILSTPGAVNIDLKGLTNGRSASSVSGTFRFSKDSRTAVFTSERTLLELIQPEANENIEYRVTFMASDRGTGASSTAVGGAPGRGGKEPGSNRLVKVLRKPYVTVQRSDGRVF